MLCIKPKRRCNNESLRNSENVRDMHFKVMFHQMHLKIISTFYFEKLFTDLLADFHIFLWFSVL